MPYEAAAAARTLDPGQRDPRPGATLAGQVPVDRRRPRTTRRSTSHHVGEFLAHVLARVDWRRDLHFQTQTTIDTLDYSGDGLNQGSKVVIAAAGPAIRELPTAIDEPLSLPEGLGFSAAAGRTAGHSGGPRAGLSRASGGGRAFCRVVRRGTTPINRFPLIVVVDDSEFAARGAGQLSLGHVHPEQPGGRRVRNRVVYVGEALGLPRLAGDRRPAQAAPRPAAGRRPGDYPSRRRPGRSRRPVAWDSVGRD